MLDKIALSQPSGKFYNHCPLALCVMAKKKVENGAVHKVPADLLKALSNIDLNNKWNILTPLARNEWICWITSVRKPETRRDHIERLRTDLHQGKRRPCCWPGCPHRVK